MVKYAAMKPIATDAHDFPSLRRDGGIYVDKDDVCLCRGGAWSGNLVSLPASPIVNNFRKSVLFVAAVAMALAVPTEAFGFSVPDKDGFSFNGSAWNAIHSVYVSKGKTCHDGLVWNPSVTIWDFGVGDKILPVFVGYWGMFSLSDTDKFPKEKVGRWIEADTYGGIDWAKFTDWKDYATLRTWGLRWHFPATGKKPCDMVAFDSKLKKVPFRPTTAWRYRYNGSARGRVEVRLGFSEEYKFFEDWWVLGELNFWYINYRNENRAKPSGLNSGDISAGLGWKWVFFMATYWFPLDKDVLPCGENPYDYDESFTLSSGLRFLF